MAQTAILMARHSGARLVKVVWKLESVSILHVRSAKYKLVVGLA